MTCKVLQTIQQHQMLHGVSTLCVGVSGGADSVALLHILLQIQNQFGFLIRVVHVNHHLRGEESDRDAEFVQALCKQLGVPCVVADFDVAVIAQNNKQSVELCGRELRYRVFREQNCDAIAVAHTLSDSIETSLFHLTRGTSLKGAAGIPAKNGNIIRPLIACTRTEIETYIKANDLPFVTDTTNLSDDYARNYIRHQIVQPLSARFPAFETCFSRFMHNAASAQDYLESASLELQSAAKTSDGFALLPLQSAHPALLQCFLHDLLSDNMSKPVEEDHIALCVQAIHSGHGKVQLAPDLFFDVRQDRVTFSHPEEPSCWSVSIEATEQPLKAPHAVYRIQPLSGEERFQADRRHWIDPQKVHFPLVLRSRLPGDVFHSPIRKQSKTLKKLFNEMKLPAAERSFAAVLAADDDSRSVMWVENVGADAAFQADITTDPVWIIRKERNAHPYD